MSEEGNMDDVDSGAQPDVDGDAGTDDVVSNGDLANRRRRQQVRQACQQCRRRKIKVHTPSCYVPNETFLTRLISAMKYGRSAGLASKPDLPARTSCHLDRHAPRL